MPRAPLAPSRAPVAPPLSRRLRLPSLALGGYRFVMAPCRTLWCHMTLYHGISTRSPPSLPVLCRLSALLRPMALPRLPLVPCHALSCPAPPPRLTLCRTMSRPLRAPLHRLRAAWRRRRAAHPLNISPAMFAPTTSAPALSCPRPALFAPVRHPPAPRCDVFGLHGAVCAPHRPLCARPALSTPRPALCTPPRALRASWGHLAPHPAVCASRIALTTPPSGPMGGLAPGLPSARLVPPSSCRAVHSQPRRTIFAIHRCALLPNQRILAVPHLSRVLRHPLAVPHPVAPRRSISCPVVGFRAPWRPLPPCYAVCTPRRAVSCLVAPPSRELHSTARSALFAPRSAVCTPAARLAPRASVSRTAAPPLRVTRPTRLPLTRCRATVACLSSADEAVPHPRVAISRPRTVTSRSYVAVMCSYVAVS
ncbi:hypothetical protein DENSPDRAFT_886376 [Dentipellis sp. KUC8613]|nr:hypothetical protein DENSPDRAFT_886376 [Dentipellis sp. KUC8613]